MPWCVVGSSRQCCSNVPSSSASLVHVEYMPFPDILTTHQTPAALHVFPCLSCKSSLVLENWSPKNHNTLMAFCASFRDTILDSRSSFKPMPDEILSTVPTYRRLCLRTACVAEVTRKHSLTTTRWRNSPRFGYVFLSLHRACKLS